MRSGHVFVRIALFWLVVMGIAEVELPVAVYAQLAPGDVLVIDREAGTSLKGALFRVDPVTGVRTLLSDFGKATQGPLGVDPVGVAVTATGTILVIDREAGTSLRGALFRVDPVTGVRTLLSDFGKATQGPLGVTPFGVAVMASDAILIIDEDATASGNGALFSVDPVTGVRTLLSDFGKAAQGPLGVNPSGVAVVAAGTVLVIDPSAGASSGGVLFSVDPSTGVRTLLSDFGDATQGPL